jgi:hypothetical protein
LGAAAGTALEAVPGGQAVGTGVLVVTGVAALGYAVYNTDWKALLRSIANNTPDEDPEVTAYRPITNWLMNKSDGGRNADSNGQTNGQTNGQANGQANGQQHGQQPGNQQNKESSQYKLLSKGEIKKLQNSGVDPHDLKPKKGGSQYDLYKDNKGNIFVRRKGGKGEADPTGLNINDY